jgi:hypothetical protein
MVNTPFHESPPEISSLRNARNLNENPMRNAGILKMGRGMVVDPQCGESHSIPNFIIALRHGCKGEMFIEHFPL